MSSPQRVPVVIVGAGQAGLAMAGALLSRGLRVDDDLIMVDAGTPDSMAWRQRWDSLKLFTPAWYSALPGLPMSGDADRHPYGYEVADYLDAFRDHLRVEPRWGVRATAVRSRPDGDLTLETSDGEITARCVVAASGPFSVPRMPSFAERFAPGGASLHSDDYRNPDQLSPGPVLVVGAGNTGIQIARELSDTHSVAISRGAVQRRLPQQWLGVDIFRWLKLTGLLAVPVSTPLGRRMARTETIIGPGVDELDARGVMLSPRVLDAWGDEVMFAGGEVRSFESVVWATGYEPGFDWLPSHLVDGGRVLQADGSTALDGLFVIGSSWQHDRGSALIGGVGRDAARIAKRILGRLDGTR